MGGGIEIGSGSPALATTDVELKAALRGVSGCKTIPERVGVPGVSASVELLLVAALHEVAFQESPALRSVQAPGWANDGEATAGALAEMLSAWEVGLSVEALQPLLSCADAPPGAMDEAKQVRHADIVCIPVACVHAFETVLCGFCSC